MVKAVDFRSGGDSTCRFDSWHGRFFFLMMTVERRAAQSAIVDASAKYKTRKVEGGKQPRMQMRSTKPEGVKRPSRCAGMSAANVDASFH